MIKKAVRGKELAVNVINEVGVLAKLTSFLVNHGINLEAVAGAARRVGEAAVLMFVTDDNQAAIDVFAKHGCDVAENDVIIVELENSPGSLKNISETLARNGINIEYIYGTTCSSGCPAKMVLSTSDNDRAILMLKE